MWGGRRWDILERRKERTNRSAGRMAERRKAMDGKGEGRVTVWTKQRKSVLEELRERGRYTAKRAYIEMELGEQAGLVLEAYDWLVKNGPDAANRPEDVEYPVWVVFSRGTAMLPGEGETVLTLSLEPERITHINIEKWGTILNYSYLARDAEDAKRHRELLSACGVGDAKAYMSRFYPEIKREIRESWKRLFDDSVILGNRMEYGTIWEIRREWVTGIVE